MGSLYAKLTDEVPNWWKNAFKKFNAFLVDFEKSPKFPFIKV